MMMKMKRIFYLLFLPILIFSIIGVVGCSNDEDVSCITGTIYIPDQEVGEKYVFIMELKMPEGNANYSDIEHIVVPKDEFPLQNYQTGDVIDFNIVEVKSEYPPDPIGYVRHTVFLCSIKQCK